MTTVAHEPESAENASRFDAYADNYDKVVNTALAASGETKEYFAAGRVSCLAALLKSHGAQAGSVLDYGCGTGASTPLFFETLGCRSMIGIDVSPASLDVAERTHRAWPARFFLVDRHEPSGDIDTAYLNGVFHHIAPADRLAALRHIQRSLREGGLFALCENNLWNPGTRHCMRVNPFDRGTVAISPRDARRLLRRAGFAVLETRYLFFFPRFLRRLRFLEAHLSRIPLGAQYLVLAMKPCRPT